MQRTKRLHHAPNGHLQEVQEQAKKWWRSLRRSGRLRVVLIIVKGLNPGVISYVG